MSELCAQYGISRRVGYKWLERYRAEGAAGLTDRSRARQTQAHAIAPDTAAAMRALREQHPRWGPHKLLAWLHAHHPEQSWPAASTLGDLLRREGLSEPRRHRVREPSGQSPLAAPTAANDCWSADFKGWFRTGDGVRCEPFTVTDNYSRMILACEPVARVSAGLVQPILARLFRTLGMPRCLRTDNGSPFANRSGLGGLTTLSVWLLTLDVRPERITPGRPSQNGRHERMHRTLGEDTASPPEATLAEQRARLEAWRVAFNTERPHAALGQRCPAALWQPSPRVFPETIPPWVYPEDHFIRPVTAKGYINWRERPLYLTEALRGQTIALAQRDDGDWAIRFRGFDLAVLGDASGEIRRTGLSRTPLAD
jgi:putative transposase